MARQVGALAVLAKDVSSIPSTHMVLTTTCNYSSRGREAFLSLKEKYFVLIMCIPILVHRYNAMEFFFFFKGLEPSLDLEL